MKQTQTAEKTEYGCVVVGGGPAGMMAAGRAAELGCSVVLCEKNASLGKKLSITGKGRCNVTNATDLNGLMRHMNGDARFLYSAFRAFGPDRVMAFFEELGVPLKVERGNRVFPVSDRAADVTAAMRRYLARSGARVKTARCTGIETEDGAVTGVRTDGGTIPCRCAVIATGGLSYPGTGSTGDGYDFARALGHTVTPLRPSLVELLSDEPLCGRCAGLTLKNCGVRLLRGDKTVYEDFGELLFTHVGVSGPTVLSASAHLRGEGEWMLAVDLKPALDPGELDRRLQRDFAGEKNRLFRNALDGLLPASLRQPLVERSGIAPDKQVNAVTKEERRRLAALLKDLRIGGLRLGPMAGAVVTAGGVSTREIRPATMESKSISGLFFAGEILDVDGYTGGFNLQTAFSTGYAAGTGAAGRAAEF